jgi:hypothetical protein
MVRMLAAVGLGGEHRAALHRLAVEVDGACAARRRVAPDVRAGQPDVLPDVLDEQRARLDVVGVLDPVDGDAHFHLGPLAL